MLSALIADDEDTYAEVHRLSLEAHFDNIVVVKSVREALRTLLNHPAFDLIIADLNFNPNSPANDEGREIGRWAKENEYPGYSVLSSARVAETDKRFLRASKDFLDQLPHDASPSDYERITKQARQSRDERLRQSELKVDGSSIPENTARLEKIHTFFGDNSAESNSSYFADGFELIAVQPESHGFKFGNPFFVWMDSTDEGVYLEVYRHPTLFFLSDNLSRSLQGLSEVMVELFIDMESDSDDDLSERLVQIRKFLRSIFHNEVRE